VEPKAGVDDVEKRKFLTLPGLELRPFFRPACRYTDCTIPAINIIRMCSDVFPTRSCKIAPVRFAVLACVFVCNKWRTAERIFRKSDIENVHWSVP
jgi:hypothetical protein